MEYLVLYTSKTGNTKQLADTVYSALPGDSKRIKTVEEYDGTENPDIVFLGFWVDRGNCPMNVADVLEKLEGKTLVLFGTCGMGGSGEYYEKVRHNMEVWLPDVCECLGFFLCQGKMQPSVLERYESMRGQMPQEQLERMIANYEQAKTHPDSQDLIDVGNFVRNIIDDVGVK